MDIYFAGCWTVAWVMGVLSTIARTSPVTGDQLESPSWWAFLGLCVLVVIVAYGVIWPIGTETHGRPQAFGFGLIWGVSEGQLFVAIWSVIDRFVGPVSVVGAIAFLAISAFTGLWHDRYWDRLVSPVHNIVEWNGRKVLFCHVPNLIVTLTFLAVMRMSRSSWPCRRSR